MNCSYVARNRIERNGLMSQLLNIQSALWLLLSLIWNLTKREQMSKYILFVKGVIRGQNLFKNLAVSGA